MRLRVLGPLESASGPVQPGRTATLLALLAIHEGRPVSLSRLMEQLWGENPPASGVAALHVYVSRLRRQLDGSGLGVLTHAPGYALTAAEDAVDAWVFRDLARSASSAVAEGRADDALRLARRALELWRGEPFLDVAAIEDVETERERLLRVHQDVQHVAARALLALGRADEAQPLAETLTELDPLNEGYWRLWMQAQHAAGNSALAISTFERYRASIAETLGIDPSERIRALHLEILRAGDATTEAARVERPVQRRAERASLQRVVGEACGGSGWSVILEGEPGIGKTALAEYAADLAAAAGASVVRARAIDGAGTPPWWIWEQVLGQLTGASGADRVLTLARAASEVDSDPDRSRFRLAEAIATDVVEAATRGPVFVLLDDLQWVDGGSLAVLQVLQARIRTIPLAVVITARTGSDRPAAVRDVLARIARDERAVVHRVAPFTLEEVEQVIGADAGSSPVALLDLSGGNPYFLSELLASGGDHAPDSVLELLRTRLSALPGAARSLLEVAAVAGRRIEVPVVGRAVGASGVEVLDALEAAAAEGLVTRAPAGWQFRHDLARQAIVESLAPSALMQAHERIAEAIGVVHGEDLEAHLDQLAHHVFEATAGQRSMEAFEVCSAAADLAHDRLAFDQAAVQRARAAAMLPLGEEHRRLRFETLMSLTLERRLCGDPMAASASLRQAIELARRLDDDDPLSRAVAVLGGVTLWNWRHFEQVDAPTIALLDQLLERTHDPRRRAELLGTLAVELYYDDERRRGESLAEQAVALARDLGDPALLGRALNNQVIALWAPGNDGRRLDALNESITLAEAGLPSVTEAIARMHRGPLLLADGDVRGFEVDLDRAARLASRVQLPEIRAQATTQRAGLALLRGDRVEARRLMDEAHSVMSATSLWGAEWIRFVQAATLARVAGDTASLAAPIVDKASEDAYRPLRWTALLLLVQAGRHEEAQAMQARWGLRSLGTRTHWASTFEWAQAAEVALALRAPDLTEVYAALLPEEHRLVVAGTAIAVWGPVAALLSRLARAMGRADLAEQHEAVARRLTLRVSEALGAQPDWPLR
ncbi:MAG TPA: BTAD domain-containing putative transcriptional regulator [Rhodoglobus sp.]|nr:BTAD domain-containing putative transcriptional regulator [Rhodoglobus sp.]